jgi:hypothetical protein
MPKPDLAGESRININGNTGWLFGVNLPWIKCGNDFGASGYGSYGIGSSNPPSRREPLSSDVVRGAFQTMQASGVNVARWFMFFDGRAGITYDAAGSPTGLDGDFFRDVDAAIGIAKTYGVRLVFVLISFDWICEATDQVSGGRSRILQSDVLQDALVNNVFVQLFQRYANEDTIIAYDVANEPEWAIAEVGLPNPPTINGKVIDPVSLQDFTRFVKQVTAAARQYALAQYVTLGSARAKWVGYWQDVGLDFYQFHYYPGLEDGRTLIQVVSDLPPDINRPVWLGEIPANVSGDDGFMTRILDEACIPKAAEGAGLAGAAPWSMLGGDNCGAPDTDALKQFASDHAADINSAGGVP